jgi:hypothetical protein
MSVGNRMGEAALYWRRELNAAEAAFLAARDTDKASRLIVELARNRVERAQQRLAASSDLLARSNGAWQYPDD